MKLLSSFLIFSGLFALAPLSVQSQNTSSAKMVELRSAAAKAAAIDASIVQKMSSTSGEMRYYKREVMAATGEEKLIPVQYCTKSGRFNPLAGTRSTDCQKTQNDCRRSAATNSSTTSLFSTNRTVLPAQRAACSSANAKSATAKEKSETKAIAKKDKA